MTASMPEQSERVAETSDSQTEKEKTHRNSFLGDGSIVPETDENTGTGAEIVEEVSSGEEYDLQLAFNNEGKEEINNVATNLGIVRNSRVQEPVEHQSCASKSKTSVDHARKLPAEKQKPTAYVAIKGRRVQGIGSSGGTPWSASLDRPIDRATGVATVSKADQHVAFPGSPQRLHAVERKPVQMFFDERKSTKGYTNRYQIKRCKTGEVDCNEGVHVLLASDNVPLQVESQGRELRTLAARNMVSAVVADAEGVMIKSPMPYGRHSRRSEGYGSLHSVGSSDRGVIYCVHGKPSGCCLVSQAEVVESNPIPIPVPDHCHRTKASAEIDTKARNQLIIATVLCLLFMIGEVIGGVLSGSLAIATDAAHLLTDLTSFCISLFSLWVAQRPSTRTMNFGWYRAEVIGALTSVLLIWVVTGILVYMAINRVITPDFTIDSTIMLISSSLGVIVNLIMGFALHPGHGHGHSHNHAPTPTAPATPTMTTKTNSSNAPSAAETGTLSQSLETSVSHTVVITPQHHKPRANINVRAAFIHVVGDLLQSVGVFIAALIIYFEPTWIIVDPICTFLFSILVLITTCTIIKDTIVVLMEGMPRDVDFNAVLQTFMNIDGVVRVHNLRIWALSLEKTALSAHLAIRPGVNPTQVLKTATRNIHTNFNFFEMTLQIEEFHPNMEECTECNDTKKI